MRLEWALINPLVVGEKVKEGFLEQVISALGFAVLTGVWQKRKKVGENTFVRKKETKCLFSQEMSSEASSLKTLRQMRREGRRPTQKAELMMGQDFIFMMGGIQGHEGGERPLCWSDGGLKAGSRRPWWKDCNGQRIEARQGQCERRKLMNCISFFLLM